jgi:hypothetical protein
LSTGVERQVGGGRRGSGGERLVGGGRRGGGGEVVRKNTDCLIKNINFKKIIKKTLKSGPHV